MKTSTANNSSVPSTQASASKNAHSTRDFQPEDYSRFLIREFLKKNGFTQTYDSFIKEDTRDKVTMTKHQLANLLGIDELMKRNFRLKDHETMLDVLCSYLIAFKEIVDSRGVIFPTSKDESDSRMTMTNEIDRNAMNTVNLPPRT